MGKAVLADLTDEQIDAYIERTTLEQKTAQTLTSKTALLNELEIIRQQGFAFDDGEHDTEVFCVGSSIKVDGNNYGSVSVSLPKYRLTAEVLDHLIEQTLICKQAIIAKLKNKKQA